MDSVAKMRELIGVAGKLISLVTDESILLEEHRADQIVQLQDEKEQLTTLYANLVQDLRRDPEVFRAVDKAVRAELGDVIERFNQAAARNERAIQAARVANEAVLRAIVDAANMLNNANLGYARDGAVAAQRSAVGRPVALSVSRQI